MERNPNSEGKDTDTGFDVHLSELEMYIVIDALNQTVYCEEEWQNYYGPEEGDYLSETYYNDTKTKLEMRLDDQSS